MTTGRSLVELYDPRWRDDPYPFYARLRESGPYYWDDELGSWVVTRYDDIAALGTDHRLSEDRVTPFFDRLSPGKRDAMGPLAGYLSDMMLFNNDPRHAVLRNLARSAFGHEAVRRRRASITAVARKLLEAARGQDVMDVVEDLSQPLTRAVIADLLGIGEADRHLLDDWHSLLEEFFTQSTAQAARLSALHELFTAMVSARAAGERDDLVDHMLAAGQAAGATREEMFANFLLIIDAGQVTTTYLIPNAVRALLRQPAALAGLRDDATVLAAAAHELMRFDSSVQFTTRICREPLRLGPGEAVTLLLASGNRDPRRFPDPDRLDWGRDARGHLSFGHGAHYCLGAGLALAEIEIVLSVLGPRLPGLRLCGGDLSWHESINFRFLKHLPVAFG
jgi:pimeloyl-[acyl-carrier protein] synthase